MSVLFVTSFAPDMYYATGIHLIESFLGSNSEGNLLVCQPLTSATVGDVFGQNSMFFLRGADRAVIESGIIGFKRDEPGLTLVRQVVHRYRSGRFRGDARWDDGYQFQLAVDEHPEIPSIDIATRSGDFDYVVPGSALGPYLAHFKGVHGPVLRLMR